MTREEIHTYIRISGKAYFHLFDVDEVIDKIYDNFEAISSLSSTINCDGCKHRITGNRYYDCLFEDCLRFSLLRGFADMYEAKDKE